MSKTITKEMLGELFTTIQLVDNERIVYSDKFLHAPKDTTERDLYELVSNIVHTNTLSLDMGYEVMLRACNVLVDLPIWEGDDIDSDDGLHEAIDTAVPVYTHDLLQIVNTNDYDLVDEALQNGGSEGGIIQACQMAWYDAIYDATQSVYNAITIYNTNNA